MDFTQQVLTDMVSCALGAGKIIMNYYATGFETRIKDDRTPVTEADIASSHYIISYLRDKYPDFGFLCEETADERDEKGNIIRLSRRFCFIIDPIDGTRQFISQSDEFAVSVALSRDNEVIAGVIFAPALSKLYYAAKGMGAYKVITDDHYLTPQLFSGTRLHVSDRAYSLIAVQSEKASDRAAEALLKASSDRIAEVKRIGSCLKGCAIAEGLADLHYRFADYTKEWDTAGEEIICREAGAVVSDAFGGKLSANRADFVNRRGIRILNCKASELDISKLNL